MNLISQLNTEQKLEIHASDIPLVQRTHKSIALKCFASVEVDDHEVNALMEASDGMILCSLRRWYTIHPGKPCYFSTLKTREKLAPVLHSTS